jgi:hypothetical protein
MPGFIKQSVATRMVSARQLLAPRNDPRPIWQNPEMATWRTDETVITRSTISRLRTR